MYVAQTQKNLMRRENSSITSLNPSRPPPCTYTLTATSKHLTTPTSASSPSTTSATMYTTTYTINTSTTINSHTYPSPYRSSAPNTTTTHPPTIAITDSYLTVINTDKNSLSKSLIVVTFITDWSQIKMYVLISKC